MLLESCGSPEVTKSSLSRRLSRRSWAATERCAIPTRNGKIFEPVVASPFQCLPGSWGVNCERECECGPSNSCDPVNGTCDCPSGLRGPMCAARCPGNSWGPNCINSCKCKNAANSCDSKTGKCYDDDDGDDIGDDVTVVHVSRVYFFNRTREMAGTQTSTSAVPRYTDILERRKTAETPEIRENHLELTKNEAGLSDSAISKANYAKSLRKECPPGYWGAQCREKCNCNGKLSCDSLNGTCVCPSGLSGPTCVEPCPLGKWGPNCAHSCSCGALGAECHAVTGLCYDDKREDTTANYSTENGQPVKIPERGKASKKERRKFPEIRETFLGHVENTVGLGGDRALPKTEYIKTIHKVEESSSNFPVPLDVALIVVASIVSLGLTSVAVAMILHMRYKFFETVRLSIYDHGNAKNPKSEGVDAGRISTILTTGTLSQSTMIRANPMFRRNSETGGASTVDLDRMNAYANEVAAIGLRISDFLQDGHYDRPTATLIRLQSEVDECEHLYDEIPLQPTPHGTHRNA